MGTGEATGPGEADLLKLVAAATLDTPEKVAAFERWKTEDGTLEGLVRSGLISDRKVGMEVGR